MLWEIWNDIRRYFTMTFMPAMRNLLASKKTLAGLVLVMIVLQMLLSILCICGIENIKTQFTVLNEFNGLVGESETIVNSQDGSYLMSDTFSTGRSGVSVFIGAICLWALCSVTVYQKITSASADRDKYIWGMYATHGAKIKKIRSMLKCELYFPHLIATAIAYPAALLMCNKLFKANGYTYSFSFLTLAVILILSYVCIRLVVAYECHIIKSMTCMDMLREEDSPKSICFPKIHSRLIKGFTTGRYARSTFLRMRRYYASIAIVAAIPAMLLVCLQVSVVSQDSYLSSEINEFQVSFNSGIDEEELNYIKRVHLSGIEGISSVNAAAKYHAAKLHTHLLTDKSYLKTTDNTPPYAEIFGDNTLVISCNDLAFQNTITGYLASQVNNGEVLIVYPEGGSDYGFVEGDRIFLAVSKLDGSMRAVDSSAALLENDLKEEYDYIELTVARTARISSGISLKGFLHIDTTYFLLSNDDYNTVTSLNRQDFISTISPESFNYSSAISNQGTFTITVPTEKLSTIPKEGDCIKISGTADIRISLTGVDLPGQKEPLDFNGTYSLNFNYAYIHSATHNGDTVTITASPKGSIYLRSGITVFKPVAVIFGTPPLPHYEGLYCAGYPADNLSILGGTVSVLPDESITVCASSAVTAAEVGTHILAKGGSQIVNTEGRLHISSLFADSSFYVALADKTTAAVDGLDIEALAEGTVTLALPMSASNYYNFQKGQKIYIPQTNENSAQYDPNAVLPSGLYDTLSAELDQYYKYRVFTVAEVVYSDSITEPIVYVCDEDMEFLLNKGGSYVGFSIALDAGIQSSKYADIRDKVAKWVTLDKNRPSVRSTGKYLEYLLRRSSNYASAVKLISLLSPLTVPFIWYYPLATLFDRRKNEIGILRAIGQKRSTIRMSFFKEGFFVTVTAFLAVMLLCYPSMLIFKIVSAVAKLPLEFEYAFLTPSVLLSAGAFSAICAAVSFAICFSSTFRSRKFKK